MNINPLLIQSLLSKKKEQPKEKAAFDAAFYLNEAAERFDTVQQHFIDDPNVALTKAYELIDEVSFEDIDIPLTAIDTLDKL